MDELENDARGVSRTLAVIAALNRNNGATVTELAKSTGISRPALYRILGALCACGYVLRRNGDSRYFLSELVLELSSGYDRGYWIAEVARPAISALQRRIKWPTDFATFDNSDMQIVQTTRDQSPFVIDEGKIGRRVSVARTSLGQAFLAFSEAAKREEILRRLAGRLEAAEIQRLRSRIEEVRLRGYAARFRTPDRNPNAAKTGSVAVPILLEGEPAAAIGFTFIASALSLEEAVRLHLDALRATKRDIESDLIPSGAQPADVRQPDAGAI